jgi:elongation factor 2
MGRKEDLVKVAEKLMVQQDKIRNIGIVAHVDHGKSTMTDHLVAIAGLISSELAGQQRFMDFYELEQQRGITINAANVSVPYTYNNSQYLINIIDTPGHVDFGGEVIRATRTVDGVILLVDAVEMVMPQTETVLREALREYVKPVLLINKVDRLFNELQLTGEQMQERFIKIITEVNRLIRANQPKDMDWQVNILNGSVAFGSGFNGWAVTSETMKKNGITFKQIADFLNKKEQKELAKRSPLHEAIIEMVIRHLPNPVEAQKYRIPQIWKGDLESQEGKDLLSCNLDGIPIMMVTKVVVDPHAGDVAVGRVFSGRLKKGMKLKILGTEKIADIQQVGIYIANERVPTEFVSAGNIAAVVGLKEIYAGETIAEKDVTPFESFASELEPVITISVEAKHAKDLPKLIEVVKRVVKEDPNVRASINQETGEHLISGTGELHLEIVTYRIQHDNNVEISTSPPIVVYRETINKKSPEVLGKSPNKHNKWLIYVEPLKPEQKEGIRKLHMDAKVRDKDKDIVDKLVELGMERDEAKRVWAISGDNILVNATRGIVQLDENKELIIQAFLDAMHEGPLAKEKVSGVKVVLQDAILHEDAIHRGPSQTLPAVTRAIYAAMLLADAKLLEPKQKLALTAPNAFLGAVTSELGARRCQIQEMRSEGDQTVIVASIPVKETIGLSQSLRGATQGRALWTAEYYGYEILPKDLQERTIKEIRKRKGMPESLPQAEQFMDS